MRREIRVVDPLNLCSQGAVRRLLAEHRVQPSKGMGQSFIVNRSALTKIVTAVNFYPEEGAFEVGTGLGTLTASLAIRVKRVVSVEKDARLFSIARALLAPYPNITVYHADALTANWMTLLNRHPEVSGWWFIANLPYGISKPVLMRLIRERHLFLGAVVTVQREVAQRMTAKPGGENYSILTVAIRLYADARILATFPPTSFFPTPEVWSAVVKMDFLPEPRVPVGDERWFFRLAEAVLMHRRKKVVNALQLRLGVPKRLAEKALQACGIDPERRGETLSLKELAELAATLNPSETERTF